MKDNVLSLFEPVPAQKRNDDIRQTNKMKEVE
jgi:hypothetical protein